MRGNQDSGIQVNQFFEQRIFQFLAFQILAEYAGFPIQNVAAVAAQFAAFHSFDDSFGVNQLAASAVHQDGAVFHLLQEIAGNHSAVFFDVRSMDGDDVGFFQDFIQGNLGAVIFDPFDFEKRLPR